MLHVLNTSTKSFNITTSLLLSIYIITQLVFIFFTCKESGNEEKAFRTSLLPLRVSSKGPDK